MVLSLNKSTLDNGLTLAAIQQKADIIIDKDQ